jgi:ribose transport system substrate-binding protein
MISRRFALISLLIVAVLLVGTVAPTARAQQTTWTIGVVHNNADHPSITAIVKGMDEEAKIYGAKVVYLDPAFDPQKQATMIEDLIAQKVDVIVVNAVDPAAVVPSIKKASEAGIPVITQNADTNDEGHKYTRAFVGSDSVIQGQVVGKMIRDALGGKGNIVILSGKPGQTDVVNRIAGLQTALQGSDIKILDTQPAEWSKDKALTITQDLLTRYPNIDAIFALDDPMALGALEAVKAANRLDKIKIFGVNGNKEACEAVKSGEMGGTALQLSYMVGVYAVRAAYDVHVGRIVPDVIKAPTAGITKDNVDKWMKDCW